jgi:hypothetical protein
MGTVTGTTDHCEAHASGWVENGWMQVRPICQARRGLRTFKDAQGVERSYCGSLGHKHDVERRFGKAGETCFNCGKAADSLAITVNYGADRLGLMCSYCQDDLTPLSLHDDWAEEG